MAASCTAHGDILRIVAELEPPHQACASNLNNGRMLLLHLAQLGFQMRADLFDVVDQTRIELVEADERRPAGEQISAEGACRDRRTTERPPPLL